MGSQRPYPVDLIARTIWWKACWMFSSPAERGLFGAKLFQHHPPDRAVRSGRARTQIQALDHCCFSQNDSRPCDAEPPITQGMPTATWPSAAAETQPSATAPTPTWPQKSRLRLLSEPLALSSSTAARAS